MTGTTTVVSPNGLMLGTAPADLLGFYGIGPAAQPGSIPDAAGGATVDTQARAAINALLQAMRDLGLIAT